MKSGSAALLFAVLLSGCTLGYRHTRHVGTITDHPGELDVQGAGNTADLGVAFDFRYFRFGMPFEGGRHQLEFTAPDGGKDTLDLIRERRFYRLEVPLLSLWNFDGGGFGGYPGLLRHRHTVDLWISGESDLRTEHQWWVDLSLVLYRYNGVGFRFFFGGGGLPVDAATPRPGTRFPAVWHGTAPMIGAGLAITVMTGEYALDALEYLIGVDKRHRERAERQNPGR